MKFTKKVYLFGLPGLVHELDLQGIPCIGPGPDPVVGGPAEWAKMTLDPEVVSLMLGLSVVDNPYFYTLSRCSIILTDKLFRLVLFLWDMTTSLAS